MKRCGKCGKDLPESEFYRKEKSPDGLQSYCKTCQSLNNRKMKKNGGGNPDLSSFTPRQLIEELRARGYKGKLIYTMENTLKYLESRAASIKTSISKAEDRLFDANRAETERVARMGWGYGMRHSKLNFSTSKSDRIKERINSLKANLDKIQRTIEFVKSIK